MKLVGGQRAVFAVLVSRQGDCIIPSHRHDIRQLALAARRSVAVVGS
jgi:hypothetical protein